MFREIDRQSERTMTRVPETSLSSDQMADRSLREQTSQPVVGMEDFNPEDQDPRPLHRPPLRRILLVFAILAGLAALLFVPPLVSMNHYRGQIASSISASLGRSVRIDSVTLNLLPMPGFTLKNFIVGEDPAFGSEPIIRANSVTAMLRVSSLWGRRVEFSRILLDSPSVNLVRLPDGRWNLESILLQASHVKAAPTAQRKAGAAPRFPYIEATGARLNIKSGLEKLPISLTDATFALWLPQPDQWQVRIEAHPARTDTAATDTGNLRVEGSLGRAQRLDAVPVNLTASWSGAPLGAVSWILLGRDQGVRGDLSLRASAIGTAGDNTVSTELQLTGLRRADFVPDRPLALDLRCGAHALALFHRLEQVRCVWPTADGSHGLDVSGDLPDVTNLRSAEAYARFQGVPVSALLDTLKAASPRVERNLQASGEVSGDLIYGRTPAVLPVLPSAAKHSTGRPPQPKLDDSGPALSGSIEIAHATLTPGSGAPFLSSEITATVAGGQMAIAPFPLELGSEIPAVLSARMNGHGYSLHLAGPLLRPRLAQLARSVPQFGDGLPEGLLRASDPSDTKAPESVLRVDLDSTRTWRGGQTWSSAAPATPEAHRHHQRNKPRDLPSVPTNLQ